MQRSYHSSKIDIGKLLAPLTLIVLFAGACGDDGSIGPGDDAAPPGDGGDADSGTSPDGGGTEDGGPLPDGATPDASVPDDELYPVLSNFRVENAQRDRLYFDSSEAITGAATAGFVVWGRTVVSLFTNAGETTGHYFTVAAPATYWDNDTIRYEGGSDLQDVDGNGVHPFTLRYVVNGIPEPEAPAVRYAAATSQGAADGSSEANAWSYAEAGANATAGMTVYLKAGRTTVPMRIANSGTVDAPIKFIGYRSAPEDDPALTREIDLAFSAAEMPLFEGSGGATAIAGAGRDYIVLRNVQVEDWDLGIDLEDADKAVIDNVYVKDIVRRGITTGDASTGSRITNSYVADCGRQGIWVFNVNNMVSGTWVVSSRVVDMDYHISVEGGVAGGNNIIRDNYIHVYAADTHGQHAIALKAGSETNRLEYNLVEDCTIINSTNGLEFRHHGTRYSVARNITAYRDAERITAGGAGTLATFQNGTSFNTLENSTGHDLTRGIIFVEGLEDGTATQTPGDHNRVINTTIYDSGSALFVYTLVDRLPAVAAEGNEFVHCTFHGNGTLAVVVSTDSWDATNTFVDCIFDEVTDDNGGGGAFEPRFSYCDFFGGWGVEAGPGNIAVDPMFDDTETFIPANTALSAGTPVTGAEYDRNGVERIGVPTIGAVEI